MEADSKINCRAPLLWIFLPLIGGYFLGSRIPSPPVILLLSIGGFLAALALFGCFTKTRYASVAWAIIFPASVALFAWGFLLLRLGHPPLQWAELPPREAELGLRVTRVSNPSDKYGRVIGVAEVVKASGHLADLVGEKLHFILKPESGDTVPVRSAVFLCNGILSYLHPDGASFYREYFIRNGVRFELRRGRILKILDPGHAFYRTCYQLCRQFERTLKQGSKKANLYANIQVAMLLGQKTALQKEQKAVFLRSGTMHLFAVSGLHVGVIALALHYLLKRLRIPYRALPLFLLPLLFLYVQITEARPSAIRAFLMIGFYYGARVFLQQPSAFSALIASGTVVLLFNPGQLWSPGFQLSYAVVGGILLYGFPIAECLKARFTLFQGLPEEDFKRHHRLAQTTAFKIYSLFGMSLAATTISAPLTIHYFNIFTPGAILLNILLLPLASLSIILGFTSILFGLLTFVWLSIPFNFISWWLIELMGKIIHLFLELPGLFWSLKFDFPAMPFLSISLLFLLMGMVNERKTPRSSFAFCAPPLILLAIIILGTHQLS